MNYDRCDLLCLDALRAEAIRVGLPGVESAERARMFSYPTRLVLAGALGEGGELCVCDLAWSSSRAQVTALLFAAAAVKEGRESWRGERCEDDCCR